MPERHYWDTTSWLDLALELQTTPGPMRSLWTAVERGALEILYSALTLSEVLLKPPGQDPPRPWPDPHPFDAMFEHQALVLVQVDRPIGERARSLRRQFNLRTPDAIHVACALEHNADVLVTRDQGDLLKLPPLRRRDSQLLPIQAPSTVIGGPLFAASTP